MQKTTALFACILVLALSLPSWALPGNSVRVFTLENGLTVITKEQPEKNLVAVNAYVKGGSRTESPDISGLSHYYEHLIFRGGTQKQAQLETRKAFQSLGTFYGFTSDDLTCYYIVSTRENLDEALWRHADAVMNLKLTQEKVDKERQVVMEEYNMDWDQPGYRAYYLLMETVYKTHPYRITPIGDKEVILNSNLDKFKTFYQERYVPNQIVLGCVGNFKTEELLEKIKKLWGRYPKGKESFELGKTEPEQKEFREASVEMKAAHTYMQWGFPIPGAAHPDMVTLELLNNILTNGENSRLYQALKVKDNLVLSVGSTVEKRKDPGVMVLDLQLEPGRESQVVEKVFAELKRIATAGVTADELSGAKKNLENAYYFDHQSFISQAQTLSFYAANSDLVLENYYLDQLRNTTAEDLLDVARKYLKPSRTSIATAKPEGSKPLAFAPIAKKVRFPKVEEKSYASTKATRKVMANGLTLVSKPDFSSNTVAVKVYVKGGLLAEDEKTNGVCNFISESLLKGTKEKDASQIQSEIDRLGISLSAGSFEDYSSLSLLSTPSNFVPASRLLVEVASQPSFPETDVGVVKGDILAQIKSITDRSYDLTNREFAREIFANSPYHRPVIGEENTVQSLTREDLAEFHRRLYVPGNMVVAVAGAYSTENLGQLEELLSALPVGEKPNLNLTREVYQPQYKMKEFPMDKTQITFNLGTMGVGVTHPDYLTLKLVERVFSRRLFFKYVYEEGIAYRMWTYLRPRLLATPFTFEMGVSLPNYQKGKEGILKEVEVILGSTIPADDFEVAKKNLVTTLYLNQETNSGQTENMAFYEMAGLGYDFTDRIKDKLKPITLKQANLIAKKYLDPRRYTMVVVGKTQAETAHGE